MKTNGLQKIGHAISQNSPMILIGLSVAGLVTTTVMAVRATPKALELIKEERLTRADNDENFIYGGTPLPKMDAIKVTWKCYMPAVGMGIVTIACIIGANSINLRRKAALASVYSLTEATLKNIRLK